MYFLLFKFLYPAIYVYVLPNNYLITMLLTYSSHTNHYIKVAIFYKKQAEYADMLWLSIKKERRRRTTISDDGALILLNEK